MKKWLIGAALLLATTGLCRAARDKTAGNSPAGRDALTGGDPGQNAARLIREAKLTSRFGPSQAVLAYLNDPGPEALRAALGACLTARDKLPGDLFNGFLTAFCRHEAGDAAAEEAELAGFRPEEKDLYRFIFHERRDELAGALRALPAFFCLHLRERPDAMELFPQGSTCPFTGAAVTARRYRSGNRTAAKYLCPKCDETIRLQDAAPGGGNPLLPILSLVADVLEDKSRFRPGEPDIASRLIAAIGLKEGQSVADIGCGYGQFTFAFAEKVGKKGKVYAEDIDARQIELVKHLVEKGKITNIVPVLGTPADINIQPGALDMALLVHVFRRILLDLDEKGQEDKDKYFDAFFAGIHRALKKNGVLVIVDHKDPMTGSAGKKVVRVLEKRRFRLVSDPRDVMDQSFMLFFKPEPAGRSGPE